MKIFITGGNGFLGKKIINSIQSKHLITSPNSKEFNLLDKDSLIKYSNNYDLIIHCATWTQAGNYCDIKS